VWSVGEGLVEEGRGQLESTRSWHALLVRSWHACLHQHACGRRCSLGAAGFRGLAERRYFLRQGAEEGGGAEGGGGAVEEGGWGGRASVYGLLEEVVWRDEWALLLACILLNQTHRRQAPALPTRSARAACAAGCGLGWPQGGVGVALFAGGEGG
jgi:hypothetical protein